MLLQIFGVSPSGLVRWPYAPNFNPSDGPQSAEIVTLSSEKPLHQQFTCWEAVLRKRDSTATPRQRRVHFKIGNYFRDDRVLFSLDTIDNQEELFHFEQRNKWTFDAHFEGLDADTSLKNMIFFRPKDGEFKGQLFRFTVGQIDRNSYTRRDDIQKTNKTKPVVSSLVILLLKGTCNFSEILYYATTGDPKYTDQLPRSLGGYNEMLDLQWQRYMYQFPSLPLEQLLPRADSHEFIGLDFNRPSCGAMETYSSTLKRLSFTSCTFADGGNCVMRTLQKVKGLTHFELELCPIDSKALDPVSKGDLSLVSLAIGQHYFVDNTNPWALQLCQSGTLSSLAMVIRPRSNERMEEVTQWESFFKTIIQGHPTLRALDFIAPDTSRKSFKVPITTIFNMAKTWSIDDATRLERVRLHPMSIAVERTPTYLLKRTYAAVYAGVNDLLRDRSLRRLQNLPETSRRELLPFVIKATSSRHSDMATSQIFSLLTENADILG